MVSKLQEMDAVIQNLYASLIQDKDKEETLLVSAIEHWIFYINLIEKTKN